MIKFIQYINESKEGKNVHLEHLEDLVFNEGVNGTRKAITTLSNLRDMLAGNSKSRVNLTTKWDGAPAIFVGIDPEDGQFFVAKKGIFNKDPQTFKSLDDINKSSLVGELKSKFQDAFTEFSKLGIKKNVYQGDLMFTKERFVKTETIDGEDYHYIPAQYDCICGSSRLQRLLRRFVKLRYGIVWHTVYEGATLPEMSASFGVIS
jgi:hypothetical protein